MLRVSLLKRRDEFTLRAEFEAPTPGVVALFGRSGCGKTTLVNIISGLLEPDAGCVQLEQTVLTDTRAGVAIPVERRRIGYVFQDARLFPHFDVLGNLRYGYKRATAPRSIGFDEVIALLGLAPLLRRRPQQLSGGERQRVSLGRALLSQPRLLLLDEPLASLDVARREEVLPYLEALRDRLSIPMVYVSHEFEEVLRLATHVVLLDSGSVVAQGTPGEVSLRPELRSIVGPDSVGAVLDSVVTKVDSERGMADVQLGRGTLHVSLREAPVGSRVRIQLLARDIILATQSPHALSVRNALQGTVAQISADTDQAVLIEVDIGGAIVLARITQSAVEALDLRVGSAVWVLVKAVSTRGHAFRMPATEHASSGDLVRTRPGPPSR
ncbi:MAG: molybdenum ABC transporter ATP-binding protein [Gammaproteobacteria bacterium]|nr:MAG: molybdenum ABC transporter ATP-binding protein [Gammaproteobacteria bacterium]